MPRTRLNRDQGAAPSGKGFFHLVLQIRINGQLQIIALNRIFRAQNADLTPRSHDLQPLVTVFTVQQRLVALFNPELADVRGAKVILLQTIFLDAFFIALIDATHVANHMYGQIAVWILAEAAFSNRNAFELKLLYGKTRDFLFAQFGANRNAVIRVALGAQTIKALDIRLGDRHDLLNFGDGLF